MSDNQFNQTAERADAALRSTLRLYKPYRVKPGEIYEAIARPQCVGFRPDGLEINDHAERWTVLDIRIGDASQFVHAGDVPGRMFAAGGALSTMTLKTLQTAMDFVMVVRYDGPEAEGEEFKATVVGLALRPVY